MGYQRKGYKRPNPERDRIVRNERDRRKRKERQKWFQAYKAKCSCKECGASHPAIIVFHHRDPETKILEVSSMVSAAVKYSQEKILEEIAKCDTLCSNCHRILHWKERQEKK